MMERFGAWIAFKLFACCGVIMFSSTAHASIAAIQSLEDQIANLFQRPVSELEALIKVRGDALDPRITVSSYGATQIVEQGPSGSTTLETAFLRAFIDRRSGEITAQVYAVIDYESDSWSNYDLATVQTLSGVSEKNVDQISSDVHCYNSYICLYHEESVFPISFKDLESLAQTYDPKNPIFSMKYRLFSRSGNNFNDAIPINEIVAFVNVVHHLDPKSTY